MKRKFNVIVVGAGPAGSTAALRLAQKGIDVLLIERGKYAGSKNMFGGLLCYSPVLNDLFPHFWEQAPTERHIIRNITTFMTPEATTSSTFENKGFDQPPYNSFTVYRPIFDRWYANKAVEAGAKLVCGCSVEDLLWEGKKIRGVRIGREWGEVEGEVVIAADGVLSRLARKAGLQRDFSPEDMGLGVKVLLGLSKEIIDERFNLIGDQGVSNIFIGYPEELRGGSFLYTNDSSISIGIAANLYSLKQAGKSPYDLLANFLDHSYIRRLIKGSSTLGYSAHLVPEGGYKMMPKLYTDGMLLVGDAAALFYNNGFNLEGVNLAITSGFLAAETIIEAKSNGDYGARYLSRYAEKLEASHVLKDLKTFRHAPTMMRMDDLYHVYPQLVCDFLERVYRVDGYPKKKLRKVFFEVAKGKLTPWKLLKHAPKIWRALI